MENQTIVVQNTNQIDERIKAFMIRKQKPGMVRQFMSGVWAGINFILIVLGAAAVAGTVLALIFPNQAGDALAWAIHQGVEWARGL